MFLFLFFCYILSRSKNTQKEKTFMKDLKKLLVLGFCLALIMTTTIVTDDYAISPCEHYEEFLPLT